MRTHNLYHNINLEWQLIGQCCAYCNFATTRIWNLKKHYNSCEAINRLKREITNEQERHPDQRYVTSSLCGELCDILLQPRGAREHTG